MQNRNKSKPEIWFISFLSLLFTLNLEIAQDADLWNTPPFLPEAGIFNWNILKGYKEPEGSKKMLL